MTRKSFLCVCLFIAGLLILSGCGPKDEPVENNAVSATQATTVTSEQTSIPQPPSVAELPVIEPSATTSEPPAAPETTSVAPAEPSATPTKEWHDCLGGGYFTNDLKNSLRPPEGKTVVGVSQYPGPCYDTVVIDVQTDNPEVGYMVYSTDTVLKRVSGDPLRLYGKVTFQLDIQATADNGKFHGYEFNANWDSFQEIRYAESANGKTTFGIALNRYSMFNVHEEREGNITHVIVRFQH